MPDPTAGILKLEELAKAIGNKQNSEQNTSSPVLNPKPFVWDSIIFSLASTIFGLSVSGIIVELFKSEQNSVTCFSGLENRAQYSYVNNYCYKFLPAAEYFPVILVLHAAALIIPHYLWRVIFSAQFDSFFSHAAKVETLQDIKTGEYPQKNYNIVDNLQKEFNDDKKSILRAYIGKLILQFLLVLSLIAINAIFFRDITFNITFDCNDDDERIQLFGNVTCAYPRKIFINVLQVADSILLALAVIVLVYSLFWCFLYNHCTQDKIADFCYNSCIDAKYYKPLGTGLRCQQLKLRWQQLKKFNDLNFLLALLSATNTGLERIFKRILVENIVYQKFNYQKNFFIKCDSIRHKIKSDVLNKEAYEEYMLTKNDSLPNEVNDLHQQQQQQQQQHQQPMQEQHIEMNEPDTEGDENNKLLIDKDKDSLCEGKKDKVNNDVKQLSELIMEICNGIREEQKVFDGVKFEKFEKCAMDLASGYHSYLFDIARWQRQTISIMLGPSSKDQDDVYECEDHGCINIMKIPINLFDLQKWNENFFKRIQTYLDAKLSLVVVGPLDDGSKVTAVNKIIEGLSKGDTYFAEGCVMLILQPVEIEGQNISETFNEWKPEIEGPWYKDNQSGSDHDSNNSQEELIKLWHEGDLSKYVTKTSWLRHATKISECESTSSCGEVEAKCGRLKCKFKLKVFYYGGESPED